MRYTNLISPRSAHGAAGHPRRWSFLAITPSPMRWFNDRLRLRRSELRNGTHCGAAAARRIHLTPTNPQSTLLLYSMFCATFLDLIDTAPVAGAGFYLS